MEDEITKLIQKATDVLKFFGAKEVYLFGSMAKGNYSKDSDIDLAVSGLPPEKFFPAVGQIHNALKREIDLIDLDESNPFGEYLKSHGELKRVA